MLSHVEAAHYARKSDNALALRAVLNLRTWREGTVDCRPRTRPARPNNGSDASDNLAVILKIMPTDGPLKTALFKEEG
jgi:hypothetical protein